MVKQTEKRIFPDFIEAYLNYTKDHEATRKVHLWTSIGVLAAALERKVWLDRGYYTLFPNHFIFIIGKSGLVKKSTTTAIGVNLLREVPKVRMISERMTAGSLVSQLVASHQKFKYGEKDISQCSLFAYASELSVFMGEVFGSIIELLTTFYDCQPNDSSKPWVYKTKHGDEEQIFGPCLNILGASTKAWLKKCIPDSEMEGGFTSRAIFVVENNPPDKLVAWPEVTGEKVGIQKDLVKDLTRISQLTGPMKVTQEAKDWFTVWYENHMTETIQQNVSPKFIGYLSRKGDHILKLAMVRSVSMGDDLVITENHVKWAERMLTVIENDMVTAFEDAISELEMEQALKIGRSKKPFMLSQSSMLVRPEDNNIHFDPKLRRDLPHYERQSKPAKPAYKPPEITAMEIIDYVRGRNAVSRNELIAAFRHPKATRLIQTLVEKGDLKGQEKNKELFFIAGNEENAPTEG